MFTFITEDNILIAIEIMLIIILTMIGFILFWKLVKKEQEFSKYLMAKIEDLYKIADDRQDDYMNLAKEHLELHREYSTLLTECGDILRKLSK